MPSFADIQHEISNILTLAEEDLTPDQRALFDAYANELADQEEDKIDGFVSWLRAEQARADYLKEEAKRLQTMARNTERKLDRLKDYYRYVMQSNGLKKVAGKVYSCSVRSCPVVLVENEQVVPKEFWKTKVETSIDKTAVRDALKGGAVVPGCSLGKSYTLLTA
jgi:sulfur carrier protein ThiS